jgi:RNA polymerase sigma-70 factor (ECF subfamily)
VSFSRDELGRSHFPADGMDFLIMSAPTEKRAIDGQATAALEAYVPGLRRYFSKRVPAGEIDDLVQEVFLRMQAHRARAPIEHMDRYLFTVAASVLSDQARRHMVRHHASHATLEEIHHPTEELTPERVLLDREALDTVVAAIADLPFRTRDVFVLHRFEEMTCDGIAAQLGMSISGVEKHIMKALRLLHERLED